MTSADRPVTAAPEATPRRPRITVVAKFVPWPLNSGDKRRTLGLVRALAEIGDVTVCAFSGDDEDVDALRREGIDVVTTTLDRSPRTLAEGLVRTRSLTAARFWSPVMAKLVREQLARADVAVIEHVQLAAYLQGARVPIRVLDMHNIESELTERMAAGQRGLKGLALRLEAKALRRRESDTAVFDAVAVASARDGELLRAASPHPSVVVVPNAWDAATPLDEPATEPVVSFVALMSWTPNVEAAQWFARNVWPRVVAAVPAARLLLVGRRPTEAVQRLADATIEVTGTVDDLVPYYRRTRVAVAPLLSGGGSRLKILEALAYGRPLVSTTVGVEGLEDLIGRGVLVGDAPEAMAAHIVHLLDHPNEAIEMGRTGARAVDTDHSWRAAARPLVDLISEKLGALQ